MQADAVNRYLGRYAEPEAAIILPGKQYDHCLVVPAFNEKPRDLLRVWQQINTGATFLVIVVVNSPSADDPSAIALVDALVNQQTVKQISDRAQLVEHNQHTDLLIIDRYSHGNCIDKKQGVGLARKIGMDIALSLMHQDIITNQWLFTTDADTELPANYFNIDYNDNDAALIYPFRHAADAALTLPMQLYETSMLYYAAGLGWANSPYAYPTIGSTISCSPSHYAAVRGFPKRNTGEDFYLLNKLRKTGAVRLANGEPIVIEGRFSDRVPIGTGQALKTIHELHSPIDDFTVEHPDCFSALKELLEWLSVISDTQPGQPGTGDPDIDNYLQQTGLLSHYDHKRQQSPAPSVMRKHLDDWFDGLKTRQFIHYFRDQHAGRVTTAELTSAPFLAEIIGDQAELAEINAALRAFIYH